MTIHKEGKSILFILLIALVGINFALAEFTAMQTWVLNAIIGLSIVLYLLILQFFRNPVFAIKAESGQVLAPADGKVVVIEEAMEDEYFKDKRKQISIFMSPLNVHVNRSPIAGLVKFFKYHPGKYLVAWHPKSSIENERTTLVVQAENGTEVLFRQIAGAVARRIKWYVKEGDQLGHGAEFGFIKFGSRVDIFLPLDAKIKCQVGENTKGGRTVIAEL